MGAYRFSRGSPCPFCREKHPGAPTCSDLAELFGSEEVDDWWDVLNRLPYFRIETRLDHRMMGTLVTIHEDARIHFGEMEQTVPERRSYEVAVSDWALAHEEIQPYEAPRSILALAARMLESYHPSFSRAAGAALRCALRRGPMFESLTHGSRDVRLQLAGMLPGPLQPANYGPEPGSPWFSDPFGREFMQEMAKRANVAEDAKRAALRKEIRDELLVNGAEEREDLWHWQGDGMDHLETLSCPVLIQPWELQKLIERAPTGSVRLASAGGWRARRAERARIQNLDRLGVSPG